MSFVPMMMFAVLFGLSMDYEVFLPRRRGVLAATGLGQRRGRMCAALVGMRDLRVPIDGRAKFDVRPARGLTRTRRSPSTSTSRGGP